MTHSRSSEFTLEGTFFQGLFSPENIENVRNMSTRDSDVYLASFPRSGTTWTQNIIYGLVNGHKKLTEASYTTFQEHFPFVDLLGEPTEKNLNPLSGLDHAQKSTDNPRLIKTHLPVHLMPKDIWPKKLKIVLVMRNPKDTCVSLSHFYQDLPSLLPYYPGSQTGMMDNFLAGKVMYGDWWKWHTQWIKVAEENSDHILAIHYKELKENLIAKLKEIANFLGVRRSDEEIRQLAAEVDIGAMKNRFNEAGTTPTNFIREGAKNAFKKEMPEEYVEKFNKRTLESLASYKFLDNFL